MQRAARRERDDIGAFDRVLVNSFFSRETLARIYGINAYVSYLPYADTVFFEARVARERFVVSVGSFDRIKMAETAVAAIAASHTKPPLVWVANSGDVAYEAEVTALAREHSVDLQILYNVPDATLVSCLRRSRLLLYTPRLEPFGYAPVEANACGAPVVAVAEGGVRETVIDRYNGLLRNRDARELGDAIDELMDNPELADELGTKGASFVRANWSPAKTIPTLEHQLRMVCGS